MSSNADMAIRLCLSYHILFIGSSATATWFAGGEPTIYPLVNQHSC